MNKKLVILCIVILSLYTSVFSKPKFEKFSVNITNLSGNYWEIDGTTFVLEIFSLAYLPNYEPAKLTVATENNKSMFLEICFLKQKYVYNSYTNESAYKETYSDCYTISNVYEKVSNIGTGIKSVNFGQIDEPQYLLVPFDGKIEM